MPIARGKHDDRGGDGLMGFTEQFPLALAFIRSRPEGVEIRDVAELLHKNRAVVGKPPKANWMGRAEQVLWVAMHKGLVYKERRRDIYAAHPLGFRYYVVDPLARYYAVTDTAWLAELLDLPAVPVAEAVCA